ncbi:MAG TPA: aldo/keto reductase, partial [Limnochordia bacterium]
YDEGTLSELATPEAISKVRALAELARSYGMRLSQMVLAYMLQMPGMGPVIPGVSSVEQLEVNAAAGKTSLSREQVTAIQEILQSSAGEG